MKTWKELNNALRAASEKLCEKMLEAELNGKKRKRFLHRIHSRLNRVRAERERRELGVL